MTGVSSTHTGCPIPRLWTSTDRQFWARQARRRYSWFVATPATLHSVGARRRAPLAVLLLIPVIVVVGITATLGAGVFAHEVRYHSYGFAAVGFVTALAAPVSGIGAWFAR